MFWTFSLFLILKLYTLSFLFGFELQSFIHIKNGKWGQQLPGERPGERQSPHGEEAHLEGLGGPQDTRQSIHLSPWGRAFQRQHSFLWFSSPKPSLSLNWAYMTALCIQYLLNQNSLKNMKTDLFSHHDSIHLHFGRRLFPVAPTLLSAPATILPASSFSLDPEVPLWLSILHKSSQGLDHTPGYEWFIPQSKHWVFKLLPNFHLYK